jgi:demethylmenaquinone methyltransferase/2-methoxy-6-polyprenyl-1,4-benzoquinol methylase
MKKGLTLKMHDHIHHPEGKLLFNEQMFGEISGKYDFITRALSLGRDTAWKKELIRHLPEIQSPSCLDLASGTGDITFRLAEKYPSGKVIGLDLTKPMLERPERQTNIRTLNFNMAICAKPIFPTTALIL